MTCALIIVGVIVVFILACIPHNLRIWRVRRAYRSLPTEVKQKILDLIQEAAGNGPSVTFLRLDEERRCAARDLMLQSHVGGVPYAEVGDRWPTNGTGVEPATFLLQVRLGEPGLGQQWQDCLLAVFLVFDSEQVVRCYAAPSPEKYVPLSPPGNPLRCVCLTPLRMPTQNDNDRVPASPGSLCAKVPAIPDCWPSSPRTMPGC